MKPYQAPQRDQALYDAQGGQLIRLNGCSFRPGYPDNLLNLGSQYSNDELIEVTLEREPENPYDSNAIKVLLTKTGEHIGYIPKALNTPLVEHMDAGGSYVGRIDEVLVTHKKPRQPGCVVYLLKAEYANEGKATVLADTLERFLGQ